MNIKIPQIIMLVLLSTQIIVLVLVLDHYVDTKIVKRSFFTGFIAVAFNVSLLWWGGFFAGK